MAAGTDAEDAAGAVTRWQRLQRRAQRTRADIEARRADSASIDSALQAVERDAQTGGGVLAAAVAFRLFMFLVPYAFVMVTGFGLSATAAGQVPEDAAHSAGIGGLLANAVASTSTMSLANRLFALVFGGIALAFTARSLVTVLRIVNRLIWGVTPSGHATRWAPLILIGYVTVLFGVIDLAAWLGSQSLGLRLVAIILTIVTSGAAWLLASFWLPREECQWWELLPGALIVGVGAGVLHLLTITYVRARGLEEVLPLRRNRDRGGAAPLDLLRRAAADGFHRSQRIAVAAPARRAGRVTSRDRGGRNVTRGEAIAP